MSRGLQVAVLGVALAACSLGGAEEPSGKGSPQFPGAAAWGEVRVTAERMPDSDFTIAPEGTEIAFFGYYRTYSLYDLRLGRVTLEVACDQSVHDLSYSPEGKLLATAEWFGGVKLRDPKTGRVLDTLFPDRDLGAFSATFLPNGLLAAYCWRQQPGQGMALWEQLAVWDPATKRRIGWPLSERSEANEEMIRRRFVGSGRYLLSLEQKRKQGYVVARSATLTDPATNKVSPPVVLDADDDFVFDASPDGRTLLVFNLNRPPRLVEVSTGRTTRLLIGHRQYVTCGAFSPDGKLIATASSTIRPTNLAPTVLPPKSTPTEILLWDATTGEQIAALRDSTTVHNFSRIRFSPNGKFLVALTRPEEARGQERKGGQLVLWGKLPSPVSETATASPRGKEKEGFVLSDRLDRFVQDLATSNLTMDRKVDAVFLVFLGRFPTPKERQRATTSFLKSPTDEAGWKDLVEVLIDTREFREHAEGLQRRLQGGDSGSPRP